MVLKSFWVKSQSSAHRQLTDYKKMDPDDILWLMQSKRKRRSCEHSIPSPSRGIDTGSCCFGELQDRRDASQPTAKKSNMQRAGAAAWCFGNTAVSFSSC